MMRTIERFGSAVSEESDRVWWGPISVSYRSQRILVCNPPLRFVPFDWVRHHAFMWQWWSAESRALATLGGREPVTHRFRLPPIPNDFGLALMGLVGLMMTAIFVLILGKPHLHGNVGLMIVCMGMLAMSFGLLFYGLMHSTVQYYDQ